MAAVGPAYPMYGSNFDASTAAWSNQEVGAYVRLLNYQWEQGHVPSDVREIASVIREPIARARDLWTRRLEAKFPECADGLRRNQKQAKHRREREEWVAKSREGGLRSAAKRQPPLQPPLVPEGQPFGQPEGGPDGNSHLPSSSFSAPHITPTEKTSQGEDPLSGAPGGANGGPKKPLNAQAQRVKNVEDITFHQRQIKPPPPGAIAMWLTMVDELEIESIVESLEGSGKLHTFATPKELSAYLFGCVKREHAERVALERKTGGRA